MACPRGCGGEDSFKHLLDCGRLKLPEGDATVEDWLTFLWKLAKVAKLGAKPIPLPIQPKDIEEDEEGEISLTDDETGDNMIGSSEEDQMSLGFEKCDEAEMVAAQDRPNPS